MTGAWAAFVRNADPGHALLPEWPAYDSATRATMYFGQVAHLAHDPRRGERMVWQ